MRTIKEATQCRMLEIYVTSMGEKLLLEMKDPYANKKPDQRVEAVYVFTNRRAKQHYWNMFQKFPENWRFKK